MRPRSLLFTVYGDYVRNYGGEASGPTLTRLLAEFGFSPQAVRAAIFRMVQQGWLSARRVGRTSWYALTDKGQRRLEVGADRIYKVRPGSWDGRWRILVYSVPEAQRLSRDGLRRGLSWLGFGCLAPGAWATPWDLEASARDLLEQHDMLARAAIFEASRLSFGRPDDLVSRCWNVDAISRGYSRFLADWGTSRQAILRQMEAGRLSDNDCFRERILLVHEWRKFLFVDPRLPQELLPPQWAGEPAAALFEELYALLSPRADRWFESVCAAPVRPRSAGVGAPAAAG